VLVHSSVKQLGSSRQRTTAAGSVRASRRQHSEGKYRLQTFIAHHWQDPYALFLNIGQRNCYVCKCAVHIGLFLFLWQRVAELTVYEHS
jgi:arylamine N-acetyltransferase